MRNINILRGISAVHVAHMEWPDPQLSNDLVSKSLFPSMQQNLGIK